MRTEFYENNVRTDGTASYLELNPEAPRLSSRGQGWEGIVVERDHFFPFDNGEVVYDEHFIGFVLDRNIHMASSFEGRRHEGLYSEGELFVSPGRRPVHWRLDDESDALVVAVMPATLDRVALETMELDPSRVQLLGRSRTRDPLIRQLCLTLFREVEDAGIGERMFVDSIINVLALHLLRHYSSIARQPADHPDRGLTGPKLRRAIEAIRDNLEGGITLPEIAEAAGVSTSHFAALFKRSTGLAPHQYLIKCRVERAQELLRLGDLPLAQVASLSGFSDQSHLTRHFKRLVGVTPAAYRKMS